MGVCRGDWEGSRGKKRRDKGVGHADIGGKDIGSKDIGGKDIGGKADRRNSSAPNTHTVFLLAAHVPEHQVTSPVV